LKKTYIYADGWILAQHDGDYAASRYFYLHDRLGSVRQIVDSSGEVANCYYYTPCWYGWAGYLSDEEIDSYYCNVRQYNAARFMTRDPVRGTFREPMSLHPYLYGLNDPVNKTDPTGEFLGFLFGQGWGARMRASSFAMAGRAWAFAGRIYTAAMVRTIGIGMWMRELFGAGGARPGRITGYTRHGLHQAISREGVGVAVRAILDAVLHPTKVIHNPDGTIKYIGENATVILNKAGEVITTWAHGSEWWRWRVQP